MTLPVGSTRTYIEISSLIADIFIAIQGCFLFYPKYLRKRAPAFLVALIACLSPLVYTVHKLFYWYLGLSGFFSCDIILVSAY